MIRGTRFYCESCGKEVSFNAGVCPNCGKIFSSVRCPKCHFQGEPAFFVTGCPQCGFMSKASRKQPDESTDAEDSEGATKGKRKKISPSVYLWSTVVLVILAILFFVFFLTL